MTNSLDIAVQQARINDYRRQADEARRAAKARRRNARGPLARTFAALHRPRGVRSAPRPLGAAEQL